MRALTFVVVVASLVIARPADAQSAVIREATVFGALPHVSEAAISPNGRMMAQIQRTQDGGRAIAFIDLDGELKPVGVGLEHGKARSLRWVGDNHVMLLVSDTLKASYGKGIETFEIWRWFIIDKEAKTTSIPFRS
jgi:hypothetical protein